MTTEVMTNGKVSTTSIEAIEPQVSEPKAKKKKGGRNNKAVDIQLDIDAGAKRVKCRLNGRYKSFLSEAKEIKGDVPLRNDGCFEYRNKSYVVGRGHDRVNGKLLTASQDNKLSCLDLWILGALAHYRKELKIIIDSRRRDTEACNINLSLRIITLSTVQRKVLDKTLKAIEKFTWEDTDFNIKVKSCIFIDEGEGAALEVAHTKNLEKFHLIDLGGGTITHTTYGWDGTDLSVEARTPISGGGMEIITNRILKAMSRTDRGAIQAEGDEVVLALELSTIEKITNVNPKDKGVHEHGWYVPLRSNGKVSNIADDVEGALSEWVIKNYAIRQLFDFISQRLAKGEFVYCSGGGFAVTVIADWIKRYLSDGLSNAHIEVLASPEHINITGLKHLDSQE